MSLELESFNLNHLKKSRLLFNVKELIKFIEWTEKESVIIIQYLIKSYLSVKSLKWLLQYIMWNRWNDYYNVSRLVSWLTYCSEYMEFSGLDN